MRVKVSWIVAALLLAGTFEGKGETLRSAIQKALSDHPRAMRAEWNTEAVLQESKAIGGRRLPQVTVDGSIGPEYRDRSIIGISEGGDTNEAQQARLVVRQLLHDGLLTMKETQAAGKRFEAAKALEADVEEQLAVDVAEAYLGVLRAREQVGLGRANIAVHEESLRNTNERYEAGKGQKVDVDLVEARLGLARSSLESRRNLLTNANLRYKQLVGREPQSLQWPDSVGGENLPDSVKEADMSGNYTRIAAEMAYEAARLDEEASKGLRWPRLDIELSGSAGRDIGGVSGNDSGYAMLLVGTWDLYSGGTVTAQQKQRLARRNEAAGLASETIRVADEDLGRAIADRDGANERADALASYANSMSDVVNAYEAQLEIGSRAILNVLDVKNEEFRAKSALLDARFEKIMAEYRMLAATSELVKTVVGDFEGRDDLALLAGLREVQRVEPGESLEGVKVIESVESGEPKRRGLFGFFRSRKKAEDEMVIDDIGNTVVSRESVMPDSLGGNKVIYVEWQEPDDLGRNKVRYEEGPPSMRGVTDPAANRARYKKVQEAPGATEATGAGDSPEVKRVDN